MCLLMLTRKVVQQLQKLGKHQKERFENFQTNSGDIVKKYQDLLE